MVYIGLLMLVIRNPLRRLQKNLASVKGAGGERPWQCTVTPAGGALHSIYAVNNATNLIAQAVLNSLG